MSETIIPPAAETPGNSPGAILKRCREYHDISLEEASETTKIGIYHLKSLEEDRISGFANLTYLNGFLRIYSTFLGLNPDDMARMYARLYGAKDGKTSVETSPSKSGRPARRLILLRKLALPALLLLLLLITATLFKRQPAISVRPSPPAAIPSVELPVSAVQTIRTSATIKTTPPETGARETTPGTSATNGYNLPASSTKPADSGKSFILKIKVTQNGNLNASIDGSGTQPYELTVGDIIEWKVKKSVALDLSNAGGVDVELDGKPLRPLGPSGKPAYLVLDADGIKP